MEIIENPIYRYNMEAIILTRIFISTLHYNERKKMNQLKEKKLQNINKK